MRPFPGVKVGLAVAFVMGGVIVADCGERPETKHPENAADRYVIALTSFRNKLARWPSDEEASAAKREFQAMIDSFAASSAEEEEAVVQAAYQVLGQGETLTYGDALIVWKLAPGLQASPPRQATVLEHICRKIEARNASDMPPAAIEESCAMLIELLCSYVQDAKGLIPYKNGQNIWDRWPEFRKAVGEWVASRGAAVAASSIEYSGDHLFRSPYAGIKETQVIRIPTAR
jgi:hypothetical protein